MENTFPSERGILSLRVRHITVLFLGLIFLSIPAIVGMRTIQMVARLPISESTNPYFLPDYAGLLYVWAPIVVISSLVMFLSPGLLFALLFNRAKSTGQWLTYGLISSIILVSGATALVQSVLNTPLRGLSFGLVVAICAFACFGLLIYRTWIGKEVQFPAQIVSPLLLSFFVVWILVAVLAPKFYWENFNGDGVHAYEAARQLLNQPFPFWNSSAGNVASFPGISSMLFAYPSAWFIRFFGDFEASSRLPYLLYLVCTFTIILSLSENGQTQKLGLIPQMLIWLSLIAYTLTVAYSATYNPYSADISLPATQDTLTMVCLLGFIYAFLIDDLWWMVLFQLLTLFSLPNGLLLEGMWIISVVLIFKPIPWRKLFLIVGGLVVFIALSFALPWLMTLLNQPYARDEYGLISLFSRFAFIQFIDIRRILYVVVPAGLLPAAGLILWKKQDQAGKALILLTIFYFGFFYIQAYTALHYFIPAMLIPLVIFWRAAVNISGQLRRWVYLTAALTGIGAVILSLPATFSIDVSARNVGATIENRIEGYDSLNPDVFRSLALLSNLFPYDWDPAVPKESYGGAALAWNYYAQRKRDANPAINYVIQDIRDQPPEGMSLFTSNAEFALYIRDVNVLLDQRAMRPDTPAGSSLYTVPRHYLFRSVTGTDRTAVISVVDLLQKAGFNLTPLLEKLGIENSS